MAKQQKPAVVPEYILRSHRCSVSYVCYYDWNNTILLSGDVEGIVIVWSLKQRRAMYELNHGGSIIKIIPLGVDEEQDNGSAGVVFHFASQGRDGFIKLWKNDHNYDVLLTECESFCKASCIYRASLGCYFFTCATGDDSAIGVWKMNKQETKLLCSVTPANAKGMVMETKWVEVNSEMYLIAIYEDGFLRIFKVMMESLDTILEEVDSMKLCLNEATFTPISFDLFLITEGGASSSSSKSKCRGVCSGSSNKLFVFMLDFSTLCSQVEVIIPLKHNQREEEEHMGGSQVSIRKDGRIFAVACWDFVVRVFHFKTLKFLAKLSHHRNTVNGVAFDSTTNCLACCSKDQNISVWQLY